MSYLKFKAGVVVPRVTIIAAALINAANSLGFDVDMLVTSGNDGEHIEGSKHYVDEALDFRTKHLSPKDKRNLTAEHLHIEWDPKA